MAKDPLLEGREALARRAWDEAFHHLSEADATGQLGPEDLDGLAEAAWASGHPDAYLPARERAHSGYLDQGNTRKAASMALQLAADYFPRGDFAVASGWRNTAERLLEGEPECVEHGRLALNRAALALILADFEEAERQAQLAFDIGKRFGDRSISAWALSIEGQALTQKGQPERGMKLIDEAMASAVSGDLSPYMTSRLFCQTMTICQLMSDFGRAGEWIKVTDRSSVKQGIHQFSGDCRVHKADLLLMRGNWAEAEAEARCACSQLEGDNLNHTAWALYELGEIQRLRGELGAAEESFQLANEYGFAPQLGLALLRLAQGKIEAAEELIAGPWVTHWIPCFGPDNCR